MSRRILPRFPALVQGFNALSASLTSGVLRIGLDPTNIADSADPTAPGNKTIILNTTTGNLEKAEVASVIVDVATQAEAEAGIDNTAILSALRGKQQNTVQSELATYTPVGAVVGPRTIQSKLQESVSLEDYWRATDGATMHLAFERALATSTEKITLGSDAYTISDTVPILRDNVHIEGPGAMMGNINLTGSAGVAFDIGNLARQTFNVHMNGVTITRSTSTAGSIAIRARNLNLAEFKSNRLFGENKFGRLMEVYHGSRHYYDRMWFENSIDENFYMTGGAGSIGVLNGSTGAHIMNNCQFNGSNAGKASPETRAAILLDDYLLAFWAFNLEVNGYLGYAVHMRGTPANNQYNSLSLFYNLNVENLVDLSGVARVENHSNTQFLGGWCANKDTPAFKFGPNSQSNRVVDMQIGSRGATSIIEDGGVENRADSVEFVSYTAGGLAAIRWIAGSSRGIMENCEVQNMAQIAINEAGTTANHTVDGVSFADMTTADPFTGFGAGTNKVFDIIGKASAPFATRTGATLTFDLGLNGQSIQVLGSPAGDIFAFRAGKYYKEQVVLKFSFNSGNIRDVNLGDIGANILLGISATVLAITDRLICTFEWDGTYWSMISDNRTDRPGTTVTTYTVAGLPPVSPAGQIVAVSNDATVGYTGAISDGVNWRRFSDNGIVS
jgi:hypothetical protein